MELNIRDFTSDNETYYMLRTKNYKKNKMKYPKNNGLLDFYKLYYIGSNENYDKNLQDLIEKNIMKDDKLFIVTFRFNDDNIVMIYRGVKTANNNFLDKYIDADEKYQKTRFKILPIIKSNSKFLNFLSKDNKPIMMAKKTETKFINNDNYFMISVNLYKNLLLRGVINKIKSNSDGFKFNLGFTIETNEKDNLKEELLGDIYVNDLKDIFC
jgi:hypothetical protein